VQFCADGRVDFRELVKELSRALSVRIELRQIGVRDETGIYGGIAVCGQVLCCSRFLKEFNSINVKMAKEQDLLLTPGTISGVCGRLKCCLKYEHEGYLELEKGMPRRGDCCECKEGRGRIIDRNLLTQNVVVQLDDTGRTVTYPKEEVSVIYPEKYKINKKENYDDGNGEKHQKNHHNNNNRSHGNGNNNGDGNGNNNHTSQQGQNRNKEQHHDRQHHDSKAGNNTGNK
jgi:cell fate regulator YaaT (PSP1 superfamily)